MTINNLKKTGLAILCIVAMLFSHKSVYAEDYQQKMYMLNNYRLEVIDQEGNMYGVFTFSLETMTKEQIDYIIQLVEENGVEELERTIESLLFRIPKDQVVCDGSISVSVNSIEKQFDIELKNESLSCMEKAVTAVYPKHTVTYHQETLTNVNNPNSTVTCLYYAHVFMHYLQSGSTIQGIQDKDFWYTDLTPNFDIHLDSLQPYIASGGWMCRVKAYYTISRDMTEGLFNVHFSRSTTDYAVAYASDH